MSGEDGEEVMLVNPVALCHGYMGFGRLFSAIPYFNPQIVEEMESVSPGPVVVPVVDPLKSISVRAGELKRALEQARDEGGGEVRFNVIAHSMAGLDVRFMICELGGDELVASLTTLGTPHGGSAVADVLLGRIGDGSLARAVGYLGLSLEGLKDLTTGSCQAFNAAMTDSPSVAYYSVASYSEPSPFHPYALTSRTLRSQALKHLKAAAVMAAEGNAAAGQVLSETSVTELLNDGLVTVASATYGTLLTVIQDVNHTDLVGLPVLRPPVLDMYRLVVATLSDAGL